MADVQIGRLMAVISKTVQERFKRQMSEAGDDDAHKLWGDFNASYMQYLMVIAAYSGINQNRLAKMLSVGKPSASKAVKYLRSNDLVRCAQDPDDARNNQLFVTVKGKGIAHRFKQKYVEMNTRLTRGFTDDEREVLRGMLVRMGQNVMDGNEEILHALDFLDE